MSGNGLTPEEQAELDAALRNTTAGLFRIAGEAVEGCLLNVVAPLFEMVLIIGNAIILFFKRDYDPPR